MTKASNPSSTKNGATRTALPTLGGAYNPLRTVVGDDAPLATGQIRFYDSYRPLLTAGGYTIAIHQQIDSTDAAHPFTKGVDATRKFAIVAPRFALDSSEVQSVFPPPNANGPFSEKLAHVVLMQRALPWERVPGANLPAHRVPNANKYPWLAVLVFSDDELPLPPGTTPESAAANPTRVGTYPVAQLVRPADSKTLGPAVTPGPDDETTCRAIDITTATFTKVTPRLAELPFLAHVRQVNVAQKTTSLAMTNGWFSVVTGNRFPVLKDNKPARYIAHLVSLEGFAPYLSDAPVWPPNVEKVRLASLASWAFTVQPEGADLGKLMLGLVAGQPAASGGEGLRLRLPVPAPDKPPQPGSPEDLARQALSQGYTALQYDTRVGAKTFAWYHGPLVPNPVPPLAAAKKGGFASAAAATIYDPATGTFDLSYAVSWELGRMLALADRAYTTSQQRSRKTLRTLVNLVRERTRWNAGRQLMAGPKAAAAALDDLVAPGQVSGSVAAWLGTRGAAPLQGKAAPNDLKASANAAAPVAKRALGDLLARNDVRGLVSRRVHAALADGNGPTSNVADWLGGLRLLEGVPFVHLVPDARMLPEESIRFFHVDGNCLDAMSDGAQSVGVQTSRDAEQQQLVRATLREAAMLRGARRQAGDPVAGFLLRSAAVSGWPGLEITAYADADGKVPMDAVRIDHLASDVLIALYPDVPVRIDIDEPGEGVAFGTEAGCVSTRNVVDKPGKVIDARYRMDPKFLRDGGVVRVDAWQDDLLKKLPDGSKAVWGPAAFALQMVRVPQRMIFTNTPNTVSK